MQEQSKQHLRAWYNAMYEFPREIGIMYYKEGQKFPLKRAFADNAENLMQAYELYKETYNLYAISFNQRSTYEGWKNATIPYNYKLNSIQDRLVYDIDCEEDLETAHNEALTLYEAIKNDYGGEPMLVFSGKKGFHLYQYFPEIAADWKYIKQYQLEYCKTHQIHNIDTTVLGDAARVLRLPFSQHQSTGKWCIPINANTSLEDILYMSETHQTDCITPIPPSTRSGIAPPIKELQIEEEIKRRLKLKNKKKFTGDSSGSIKNWNVMHNVFPALFEEGTWNGKHWIVKCPFHNDSNASAFYTEHNFWCSTCDINIGTYRFLTKYCKYSEDKARNIIKEAQ